MAEQEAWKDQSVTAKGDQERLDGLVRELNQLREKRDRLGEEIISLTRQSGMVRDAIEVLRARMKV